MYYLRLVKENDYSICADGKTRVVHGITDRAIYKSNRLGRYYRDDFDGIDSKHYGVHLYTCKKLKTILSLRNDTFDYCGEWFDVYDENGKVELPEAVQCGARGCLDCLKRDHCPDAKTGSQELCGMISADGERKEGAE